MGFISNSLINHSIAPMVLFPIYGRLVGTIVYGRYNYRLKFTWLVVWNMNFIFPFGWEFHHPNWLSYFQRGWNHQLVFFFHIYVSFPEGTGSPAALSMVHAWYQEITNPGYDFDAATFKSGTGHFTQVVWKGRGHWINSLWNDTTGFPSMKVSQ